MTVTILSGDCRDVLATLPDRSVQCCVTSPPYFGLRDYGHEGQIGLEQTPDAYVAEMVAVFREVRRVLRDDGTLWLNLGDSYAGSWGAQGRDTTGRNDAGRNIGGRGGNKEGSGNPGRSKISAAQIAAHPQTQSRTGSIPAGSGFKPKDLLGIPWLVAFALRADGWYLRQDIIWAKPNPMPESITDRCTKAHEYVFLLSKSARYFYDAKAVAEDASGREPGNVSHKLVDASLTDDHHRTAGGLLNVGARDTRNRRSVWTIATQPYSGAHFATMPPGLAETCINAGSRIGDTILDPFGGAGTTALVADRLQRDATIIELNPAYAALARDRINSEAGLFAPAAE
jgi:DNA modification methylase